MTIKDNSAYTHWNEQTSLEGAYRMEFHSRLFFLDYNSLERFTERTMAFKTKQKEVAFDLHIKENDKQDMHISGKNR